MSVLFIQAEDGIRDLTVTGVQTCALPISFYAGLGADQAQFLSAMQSFGVDVKVRRATAHMQRCKVDQTPSIVINGRYLVKGATREDMLRIASYLIEKEHHS